MVNECYYCGEAIEEKLDFCPSCGEPLIECPNCGRYNSPLASWCYQCSTELPLSFSGRSDWVGTLTLSRLVNAQGEPFLQKVELQWSKINTEFLVPPAAAFGYLFVVSSAGELFIVNQYTLTGGERPAFILLLAQEQVLNPPLIICRRSTDSPPRHEWYCCIVAQRHLYLFAITSDIDIASNKLKIVLRAVPSFPVELPGDCVTSPIWTGEHIFLGTTQGVYAYDLQGKQIFSFGQEKKDWHGTISTNILPTHQELLFGTAEGTTGYIYAVTLAGRSVWAEPYVTLNRVAGALLSLSGNRVVLLDEEGVFYNLDVTGELHYAPKRISLAEDELTATFALGFIKGDIYAGTRSGRIYRINPLGDLIGEPQPVGNIPLEQMPAVSPTGQLFFLSRTALRFTGSEEHPLLTSPAQSSTGILAFASRGGNLYLLDFSKTSIPRLADARVVHINLPFEASPIFAGGYLYLCSRTGILLRLGKNEKESD